jgi:TRAP-type C4-dicarboxylate transport system permease small subunit
LLSMLFVVPIFVPSSALANSVYFSMFSIFIVIAWIGSRLVGRQLSKTSSLDSILIYRFFASVPWIFSTIFLTISLLTRVFDDFERQFSVVLLCVSVLVSSMHVIGIVLHLKSLRKTIHNVKKDDLFQ